MKQKWIKISVLTVVFILAIIGFSILTNRDTVDMTAAMDSPTLPTITYEVEGFSVNTLVGYVKEMNIPAMRDTITPLDKNGQLKMKINVYDAKVEKLTYEVYPLAGGEALFEKSETELGENIVLSPGTALKKGVEAVLCVTLHLSDGRDVYYYTRIVQSEEYQVKECLKFAKDLHKNILAKNDGEISRYLEPSTSADNSTLNHVTIESDVTNVMWGVLKPEITSNVNWDIKETNSVYTSILLKYRVKCMGETKEEVYEVNEFFKVRKYGKKLYLLAYDRTMEQLLDKNGDIVSVKGVELGITSAEVPYKVTKDGDQVAFVQGRQLWSYDRSDDSLTLVFGFEDGEKEEVRNIYDQHNIRIVNMDDKGNMSFMVYGYMNRGSHEGEVGVAFYNYNHGYNTLEEKVFISSDKSFAATAEELCKFVYYNDNSKNLYLLTGGSFLRTTTEKGKKGTDRLAKDIDSNEYVLSEEGNLLAYQKDGQIGVLDLETEKTQTITPKTGEKIRPLGFIGEDFIYGVMKEKHAGKTVSGTKILPMYKLEICDKDTVVVKTYQEKNQFISDVFVEDGMVTLKRVKKKDGKYHQISEDYITNNEEQEENNISLQSYASVAKKKQYRLEFADRIEDVHPKALKAKLIVSEYVATKEIKDVGTKECFYVYGAGAMKGVYNQAGYAVQKADEIEGVVVSNKQTYVWERGNQEAWRRIGGIDGESRKEGETSLEACLRILLRYEGVTDADRKGLSPLEVLSKYSGGEALDLTGCEVENLRYMIGKGNPVIAMEGSSDAVLLIGYQANTIIYMDPADGKVKTNSMKAINKMTEASGHTYLGYVKAETYE